MEYLVLIAFFVVLVLIVVFAVKFSKKTNTRKQNLFQDFAIRNGLNHSLSKQFLTQLNHIHGEFKGFSFRMSEKIVGSGKHQTVVLDVEIHNTGFDFEFKIGHEHFFSKAGKFFGKNDIQIGNTEIDERFLFKSDYENRFIDLMTYEIQNELKMIDKDLKAPILTKAGTLAYTLTGSVPNQVAFDSLEKVIDFMLKLISKRR